MTAHLKKLALRAVELSGALVLVVVFFGVFLAILGLSFPRGTSLSDLVGYSETQGRTSSGGEIDVDLLDDDAVAYVASLADIQRRVKAKPAGGVAWTDAQAGMPLGERHAVQTLSRSSATIRFSGTSEVTLGESSLLVLRKLEQTPISRRKRASVVVLEGGARAEVGGRGEAMELELQTSSGSATASSAAIEVAVRPDHGSVFSVHGGSATVSGSGRSVHVPAGYGVAVAPGGAPGKLVRLPPAPRPSWPPAAHRHAYREVPRPVRFAWEAHSGSTFRLQVAADADFAEIVEDVRISGTEASHEYLAEGTYHWRVRAVRDGGEGVFSPARTLEVVRDTEAPVLDVELPEVSRAGGRVDLTGRAEPGVRVLVTGEPVAVGPDGAFRHELALAPGMNVVVVEAIDDAGNVTYRSGIVRAEL